METIEQRAGIHHVAFENPLPVSTPIEASLSVDVAYLSPLFRQLTKDQLLAARTPLDQYGDAPYETVLQIPRGSLRKTRTELQTNLGLGSPDDLLSYGVFSGVISLDEINKTLQRRPLVGTDLPAELSEYADLLLYRNVSDPMEDTSYFFDPRLLQQHLGTDKTSVLLAVILLEREKEDGFVSRIRAGAMMAESSQAFQEYREAMLTEGNKAQPYSLTDRECLLLTYASQGFSNAEIATALDLAVSTVKNNFSALFIKIGARNRAEARTIAMKRQLIGQVSGQNAGSTSSQEL